MLLATFVYLFVFLRRSHELLLIINYLFYIAFQQILTSSS